MTMTIPPGTPAAADVAEPAEPCDPSGSTATSLYDAIGGHAALVAAVDGLYGRLLADPQLAPFFPGGVGERHRRFVVSLLAEALGGPYRYRGPDLAESHRSLGITGAHFDSTAGHLVATLDGLGVPPGLAGQVVAVVAGLRPALVTA